MYRNTVACHAARECTRVHATLHAKKLMPKERAVDLAYRDANGTLHPWDNQIEIIEQDPTKGMQKKTLFKC